MVFKMRILSLGIFSTLFAIGVVTSPRVYGQAATTDTSSDVSNDPVYQSWEAIADVQGCFQCHSTPPPGRPDLSFSRRIELALWVRNDKHAIARRRVEPLTEDQLVGELNKLQDKYSMSIDQVRQWGGLSNILSFQICDKLGYDVSTQGGYDLFLNNCATCHGGYRRGKAGEAAAFSRAEKYQPGISCNYCHQDDAPGASGDWIDKHGVTKAATEWRNLSPEQKTAQGMSDLVNVGTQAANCFDCHIGNRDKNMFVTHVMFAAGHPPLPGIELQTFCSQMPQHWVDEAQVFKSLTEAQFAGRDEYFKTNFPQLYADGKLTPDRTYFQTRKLMIGALAARLQVVELLADSATTERWADYSLYDCAACHHELREPSARQARGYAGAPGRPRQYEWPDALIGVALDVAGPDVRKEVDAKEQKLALAFSMTPFGEPRVVGPVAKELTESLQKAIEAAEGRPFTAVPARAIIKLLAQTPSDKLLVYDSARQVVWAIGAIAAELEAAGEPLPQNLAAMIASLGEPTIAGIETTLPAGRKTFIYRANLDAELERKAAFDIQVLRPKLDMIAREIVIKPAVPVAMAR